MTMLPIVTQCLVNTAPSVQLIPTFYRKGDNVSLWPTRPFLDKSVSWFDYNDAFLALEGLLQLRKDLYLAFTDVFL